MISREIRNLLHFLSNASKVELIACNNYIYIYLHCDVVEWLVQLTWGALTEKIHKVLLVVIHWNSFDCPRLFRALCASTWCDLYASTSCNLNRSTTAFASGRANDEIQRYFGQCSKWAS
jgi:hypothetical protein